jgi:hypothetical protein
MGTTFLEAVLHELDLPGGSCSFSLSYQQCEGLAAPEPRWRRLRSAKSTDADRNASSPPSSRQDHAPRRETRSKAICESELREFGGMFVVSVCVGRASYRNGVPSPKKRKEQGVR